MTIKTLKRLFVPSCLRANRFLLLFGLLFSAFPLSASTQPNILLIMVDDLRDWTDFEESNKVHTPNLDRFAERALSFERAYCQYPVCNPSRSSYLTGLRPASTGIRDNVIKLRERNPDILTMPRYFKDNGYFTASIGKIFHSDEPISWDIEFPKLDEDSDLGKTGVGKDPTNGALPWCHWLEAEGADEDQRDGQIARGTVSLLQRKHNKPFFIAMGIHKPHDPFIAPKKYFDRYPLDSIKNFKAPLDADPTHHMSTSDNAYRPAFAGFSEKDWAELVRAYYAGITFADAMIGKVLDELSAQDLWDNTIVIIFSDHGYHLGEQEWFNKVTLTEIGTKVPFFIHAPGMTENGKTNGIIELIDIFPTLTDLSRIPTPSHLEGKSIVPLLRDPKSNWNHSAYSEVMRRTDDEPYYAIRTDRWRYIDWREHGEQLFDPEKDPKGWHNLADDPEYKTVIRKLKGQLQAYGNY